jgi:HTH-type transcriptional regulator/antitoxin HigA
MSNVLFVSRLPATSIPSSYEELARLYIPRPIRDERDYDAALEVIDWLAGYKLNQEQDDFLDAVSTFVEAYEARTEPSPEPKLSGLQALRYLLEENDLGVKDLARLLHMDPSVASRTLNGQRKLTPQDLRILAAHFCVPADLLVRA